ncbi:DUF1801 domain-containing protein [Gynurincola endophyticus]|jgi:uncharacterized protein YihD (DUF1040 family)|uniref:DUF1801 domain-containing protein n=1 Tax=Gynurincola endophyticus TaxID=2479004 RepID=UPI000F8DD00B|nr:DUF1801 domain-containing protein [Gynurincola endophyticus]
MPKNKTAYTEVAVTDFINNLEDQQQQADSLSLIRLMKKVSKEEPRMFGATIIGFGQYQYKYASGHAGEAPLLGFSPRKAAISLYVFTGAEEHQHLLENLGKYKIGKACIYVKKLADINEDVLVKLMQATINYVSEKYTRIKL